MKKAILFLSVFIALANTVSGQANEITGEEYRQEFRPAYDKIFDTSYRKKSTEENYEDGKLSGKIESFSEFIPPNKYH